MNEISLNDEDLTENLEFWMSNLPPQLKTIPLINLAIPGSHDSATYGITPKSELAPDAEPILKKLRHLGPILTLIMSRWSKTQTATITEQLNIGIRYFDLRIATKQLGFYIVHGLYAEDVVTVLEEIKVFLETHPKEVVILDCQHFYGLTQLDHERLMYQLTSIFNHKLLPFLPQIDHINLQYMSECSYQVIAIYRSDAARFGQPLLWPSPFFPTPWPNTVSVCKLVNFLNDKVKGRNPHFGFVSQFVLTPTVWFVVKHLFSTLRRQCVLPLDKEKYKWLHRQRPGPGGINIVICDFVEGTMFTKAVINLNKLLLDDKMTPVN